MCGTVSLLQPPTHVLKPQNVSSDEIVLEQLSTAEQKLVTLSEELASRDLDTIHKEMEDEEFRQIVEGGVAGNIKVELSKRGSKPALYGECRMGREWLAVVWRGRGWKYGTRAIQAKLYHTV